VKGLQDSSTGLGLLPSTSSEYSFNHQHQHNHHNNNNNNNNYDINNSINNILTDNHQPHVDNDSKIIQDFESQLLSHHHIPISSSCPSSLSPSSSISSSQAVIKLDVYIKYIKWMRDR